MEIHIIGIIVMLVYCVVNWDTMISVSEAIIIGAIINFLLIITGAAAIGRSYFNNRIMYRYNCNGNEASLQSCSKYTYSSSSIAENWYNRPRAAVECQQTSINLTSKTVQALALCVIRGLYIQSHVQWRVLLVL